MLSSLMAEPQSDQVGTSSNIVKNKETSTLSLKVTSGLSNGLSMSITSATTPPKITIGRHSTPNRPDADYSPFNLTLQDRTVSRNHAVLIFNTETQNWEITDTGSRNGIRLNSRLIPWYKEFRYIYAAALSNGDVLNFCTSVNVLVEIKNTPISRSTGISFASNRMVSVSGKMPPMMGVGLLQYPLPGVEKFGLFGVFDGLGESNKAAEIASKTFHENVAKLLSQSGKKEEVLRSDASGILKQAFALTETEMNKHVEYKGFTATALLIWSGSDEVIFAQCANLGDTECVIYIDGRQKVMTEVHKWNTAGEKKRLVKTEDGQIISEPYVSEAQRVPKQSTGFVLVASNGLWEVFTKEEAVEFVLEIKESLEDQIKYPEEVAKSLVREAKSRLTQGNTTVIFIDFEFLTF